MNKQTQIILGVGVLGGIATYFLLVNSKKKKSFVRHNIVGDNIQICPNYWHLSPKTNECVPTGRFYF
jgi:hypothetical protein